MKKMRGIRETRKAALSAKAGLLGLALAAPICGMAAEAVDSGNAAAGVLTEREAKFNELLRKGEQAKALAAEKKFNEADKLYSELTRELSVAPGTVAAELLEKIVKEHGALKVQWGRSFLTQAREFFNNKDYAKARSMADQAFLVDPGCQDEVEDLKERCDKAVMAEEYRHSVSSVEVMNPKYADNQQKIDDLMRRAVGFYEANALDEARATCESVFRLDPYNAHAAELLERVYERLYTYGSARRNTDFRSMFAYMSWNWDTPVFPDQSDSLLATMPMEMASATGVMSKLDHIIIDNFQVEDMTISNALKTLDKLVKSYDKEGTGVEFLTTISKDDIEKLPKITLDLHNIPASEILKYVCMLTDTKYFVDRSGRVNINFAGEMEEEEFSIRSSVVTRISRGKIRPEDGMPGMPGMPGRAGRPGIPGAMPGTDLDPMSAAGIDNMSSSESGLLPFGAEGVMGGAGNLPGNAPGNLPGNGFGSNSFRYEDEDAVSAGLSGRTPGVGASDDDRSSRSSSGRSRNARTSGIGGRSSATTGMLNEGVGVSDGSISNQSTDISSLSRGSVELAQEEETIDFAELEEFFTNHGIPFDGKETTIVYNPISNTITARNTSANLSKMAKLLNVLNAQEPMVLIEAKILELSEVDIEQLGFNWFLSITQRDTDGDTNIDYEQPSNPIRNNDSYTLLDGFKIFPNFGESLFGDDYDVDLSLSINAVSQNKNVEIINAPRLVTTNNTEAVMTVNETRYYPTDWEYDDDDDDDDDNDNNNSWSDSEDIVLTAPEPQFDDGGTDLGINFYALPQIDSDMATITLTLRIDTKSLAEKWHYPGGYDQRVYQIENGPTGTPEATLIQRMVTDIWMPVYAERSLSAKVRVYDGETIVIGGMIDSSTESYSDKWPILGELPLIGRLFRQQNDRALKGNMLVFVTTRLVNDDGVPLRNERTLRGVPTFKN